MNLMPLPFSFMSPPLLGGLPPSLGTEIGSIADDATSNFSLPPSSFVGQSFTMNSSGPTTDLSAVEMKISINEASSGQVWVDIHTAVSAGGGNFKPSLFPIGSSNRFDSSSLPFSSTADEYVSFLFGAPLALSSGTKYFAVLNTAGMTASSYIYKVEEDGSLFTAESWATSTNAGSSWKDPSLLDYDLPLKFYVAGTSNYSTLSDFKPTGPILSQSNQVLLSSIPVDTNPSSFVPFVFQGNYDLTPGVKYAAVLDFTDVVFNGYAMVVGNSANTFNNENTFYSSNSGGSWIEFPSNKTMSIQVWAPNASSGVEEVQRNQGLFDPILTIGGAGAENTRFGTTFTANEYENGQTLERVYLTVTRSNSSQSGSIRVQIFDVTTL